MRSLSMEPIHPAAGKKLSKLETFVWRNQDITFEQLAAQTNRTIGEIERAFARAAQKMEAK